MLECYLIIFELFECLINLIVKLYIYVDTLIFNYNLYSKLLK